ncbi:MAG TPA: vanadium-dependent haloperoxidase, partial [Blastocatellia bacterium]|nr:vanadium-dependent haloperoxidase [Blastocatellia bacterium]
QQLDPTLRYVRNGRDLARWVQVDVLFQAYFNAVLILQGMRAPVDANNPYNTSSNQMGMGVHGPLHIQSLVPAVATRAFKAIWHHKWRVHRRLRPEVFGGRIHNHRIGATNYPIHPEVLNASVVDLTFSKYGTYLLPQAFVEGSPTHPSYLAGHAGMAGACTTVVKAFFEESFVIPDPVVASPDGLSLLPYQGPPLTVGGELNKVAWNVAMGRDFGGIHYRSDQYESMLLGEEVAINFLREEKMMLNEKFPGWTLTKFDGTKIII